MPRQRKRARGAPMSQAAREAARAYGEVLRRLFTAHSESFQAWGAEGGKARARRLTADERRAIARQAARARWGARKRRS